MKKDLVIKIVVPVIIVCLVGTIWLIKDKEKQDSSSSNNPSNSIGASESKQTNNNPDFDLHVTKKIDLEKLKSYGLPIIIDFGADSCIPCKEMAPVLKELNETLRGKAIIKYVDVRKYGSFAEGYPVELIPTQIFIDKHGKPYIPKNPESMKMLLYQNRTTNEHVFTTHEGYMDKIGLVAVLKEMGLSDE